MRCLADERLALVAPAMGPHHARGGAGLVNEHQRLEVEPGLRRLPDRTRYRDVGPVLLAGVDCSFFLAPASSPSAIRSLASKR